MRTLIYSDLPQIDLVDILIQLDQFTNFLRHFVIPAHKDTRQPLEILKRNAIAALIAGGCNIGAYRMSMAAPGITPLEISTIADWFFTTRSLKAAAIDVVNFGLGRPITQRFGAG